MFSLTAQEGRLFRPLAFTKTFSMFFASFLGVTLVPVLMRCFIRGKITPENKNPVNRFLIWAYQPFVNFVLRYRWFTLGCAVVILVLTIFPFSQTRQRIHAAAQRRHAALHADRGAGHVDHRGDEDSSDTRSTTEKNSRSHDRFRKSRPSRNADRSRAALDVRDDRRAQTA